MRPLVTQHIESLKPYVAGKPISELKRELGVEHVIKLASNENPLGASPKARSAIAQAVDQLHLYPDAGSWALRHRAHTFFGVPMDELVVGNGSNELLTLAVRTFTTPDDHAVISDYAFIAYRLIMQAHGLQWSSVPTLEGFETDIQGMIDAVIPGRTKLLFLANPNNPTGTYIPADELEHLLRTVDPEVMVVVDEAYTEYVQATDYVSALSLRHTRERLMITRTLSKAYGLGGLRVGFGIAPAQIVNYLNRVREPFNCGLLAQEGATAALDDQAFIAKTVELNEQARGLMQQGLDALASDGVQWTPSQTNFLLLRTPHQGAALYQDMLHQGVIVRPMGGYGLPHHLRVTLGTVDECEAFLDALTQALANSGQPS